MRELYNEMLRLFQIKTVPFNFAVVDEFAMRDFFFIIFFFSESLY